MARYTGPMTRKSRRLRTDLVGGDQAFEKRPYPPGQHGRARIKESEYLQQLQEKQKARFTYGVMEKQFRRYYEEAIRHPGKTGENLLQILESRLDNVVYRAGLARTRRMARQLVSHGHFTVNGVHVDVPSYRVSQYDIIDVRDDVAEHGAVPDRARDVGRPPDPELAAGRRRAPAHPDPPVARAGTDRRAAHRAADRRVLLEVTLPEPQPRQRTHLTRHQIAGAEKEKRNTMLISQRPTLSEEILTDSRSQFVIEPLEPGFGYTLGNSLRRTLLSSIPGAAVTSIRIDGVLHEFTTVPGVKEDVTAIILNLKGLVVSSEEDEPVTMYLRKQGPGEVTAGDIVPPAGVTVHNPGMHIATLNDKGKLEVELVVERGRGYVPAVQNRASGAEIGRIPVDSIYSPVLKVTYKVDATRVEQRTDFDKLILDVETKSSITPRDALASAGKTLVELFGLARELNVEAEGIEIGPSPAEADHIASFALPIDDLDLTVRSYNCLKREGVHTVGELVWRTESDLLDIRNFGQKSIDEVKVKLHQLGLSLKDSPPSFDPSEVAGYDVATGTWSTEGAYDDADYAETEQL